jgi:hypothetical protein
MMHTAEELRREIAWQRDLGERLDKVDYCGRLWLADYAGLSDTLIDCLEELLDQGVREVEPFATDVKRMLVRTGRSIPMGGC